MFGSEQSDFAGDVLADTEFLDHVAKGQEFLATRNGYSCGIQRAHLVTVKSVSPKQFRADLPDMYTATFWRVNGQELADKHNLTDRWAAHALTEAGRAYLFEEQRRYAVWQLRNRIKLLVNRADSGLLLRVLALLEAEVRHVD